MRSADFTNADLARVCGVSKQSVARWLRMKDADLAAKHLLCAADALDAEFRQLVTGRVKKGRASK